MASFFQTILALGPKVFLKADEASGNLIDSSGFGHDGVVSGTALTYGVSTGLGGAPRMVTLAVGSRITITDHADIDLGNGPFSIFFLLARASAAAGDEILVKGDLVATAGYAIEIRNGTPDTLRLQDGSSATHLNNTGVIFEDTNLHGLSFTRAAATNAKEYVDGSSVAVSATAKTFTDNNNNLVIGSSSSSISFSIAAIAIFKTELTAADETAIWAARNNQELSPAALALSLGIVAPALSLGSSSPAPGALALTLATPAPAVQGSVSIVALPLTLGIVAPTSIGNAISMGALPLGLALPAPAASLPISSALFFLNRAVFHEPPEEQLGSRLMSPVNIPASIGPPSLGLNLTQPAFLLNQKLNPGALLLGLSLIGPSLGQPLSLLPPALALSLTPVAPTISLATSTLSLVLALPPPSLVFAGAGISTSPAALALGLALGNPTLFGRMSPAALALALGLVAPTVGIAPPIHRLRDVQYHAILFAPDGNGGPGMPKYELDADMLNVTWSQGLNFPGQAAFTLSRFNPKLTGFAFMQDHIKIYREDARGTKVVFAGKIVKPSESAKDAIIYCWDYAAFLQRSRTGFRVLYPEKTIKEIVDAEWAAAKAIGTSLFSFVATGTTETPLGLDNVTPIKTNNQFGVIDFDRLYLFNAMAEISMANTSNTVVFEITRDAPHTFNFWKNRSTQRTNYHFSFPGNLIDYDKDDGTDQQINDLATVILDPQTGSQVEYALADLASIASGVRRLQGATTIKTLFGITTGTTESDQQKAALARLLTISAGIPRLVTAFPRQNEFSPFDGWELGDSFRTTLMKADRSGDNLDAYLKATGIAAAWTPDAGELMQVFLR